MRHTGAEARALGGLMVAGAGLVGLSLALPHPEVADLRDLVAIAVAMLAGGLLCFGFARRVAGWAVDAILAAVVALTGLPNRRTLDEQLPREMARARRSSTSLCLAILDIDFFKAYNDAHGHLAGDGMLRDCAEAWDSELRGEDVIVRYGGEEFLVLLPGASLDDAAETVERLRAATPDGQTCSARPRLLGLHRERRGPAGAGGRGALRGEGRRSRSPGFLVALQ